MVKFYDFKIALQAQFEKMSKHELFVTGAGKDILWDTYLNSYPEGTNPIFKERTEHDCQCCKQFIRTCGNVVSIIDNRTVSIWDIEIAGHYQVVADALSALVRSRPITDIFLHYERNLGTNFNNQLLDSGKIIKWEHFYFKLPKKFVKKDAGLVLSEKRSSKEVFKRGLDEINLDAVKTVLEFIEQKSIYRGEEYKSIVELFLRYKEEYYSIPEDEKDNFCWSKSSKIGSASRIRNTAIGTLLTDISGGMGLDDAVRLFESKVAPTNYKRPTALITKSMIANAQKKVAELGIENSLKRRYAIPEDVTINNVLFANRTAKKAMNVFDELAESTPVQIKNMDRVDSVDIDTFINTILPKVDSVELMLENRHINNLVSLIAPTYPDAKNIFNWGNNFSWAYNGEVTDSIKERVKKAGGNINGILNFRLGWFNYDDLDAHCSEPNGNYIDYHSAKIKHQSSGVLDVDMNAGGGGGTRKPVENITHTNKDLMPEGVYNYYVNQYQQRESKDIGFEAEIEFEGKIFHFSYNKIVRGKIHVAEIKYSRENGIEIIKSLPHAETNKDVWGVTTNGFQKVSMVMNSPNHWNGNSIGNKHYFFMLDSCKNPEPSRGFFNEFLSGDLRDHRKVFEVLGSRLKTEKSDHQLSGIGFSSTQRNSVLCKVSGSFTRIIKLNF